MRRELLLLVVVLAAAACNSPAAPTARRPSPGTATVPSVATGPPVASLVVERVTLVRVFGDWLAASVQVAETSGASDARVESLTFNLADGVPWSDPRTWPGLWRVAAGGRAYISDMGIYGDPDGWRFEIPAGYGGRVSVLVTYYDNQWRKGTVTAIAAVPQ